MFPQLWNRCQISFAFPFFVLIKTYADRFFQSIIPPPLRDVYTGHLLKRYLIMFLSIYNEKNPKTININSKQTIFFLFNNVLTLC
jgi:hypothetical protein